MWDWLLGGSALLVVLLAANCCSRLIRICRKKCHSLTGC
jgi:hypothetical protein